MKMSISLRKIINKFICLLMPAMILFQLGGCVLLPETSTNEALQPVVKLEEPKKIAANTYTVRRGDIENRTENWGVFVSPHSYQYHFKTSGILKVITASYSQEVLPGDVLAELDTENLKEQLEKARINLKRANLDYEKIRLEGELNGGGNKYQIESAKIELEIAELDVRQLEGAIGKSVLKAENKGVVTSISGIPIGGQVNSKDVIVVVTDRSGIMLVSKETSQADKFSAGMKVNVKYRNNLYEGEIVKLPKDTLTEEEDYLTGTIQVKVSGLPEDVSLNDIAGFYVINERAENAILIKKRDVYTVEGKSFVMVNKDGIIQEREIKTGIVSSDSDDIEIVDGLSDGDEILIQ